MSAPESPDRFYDRLARRYHLLFPDWTQAIDAQAAALARLIEGARGAARGPVLDCACGIGTQALGLAALGYTVTGMDLSPKSVARAIREARARRLASVRFSVGDMRKIPREYHDAFDVVICCGDPLAHLLHPRELRIAFLGMRTALRPGGLLVLSSRDYDRLVADRPREMAFHHRGRGRKSLVTFQIWDWRAREPTYVSTQFILRSGITGWKMLQASTTMRAYTTTEITEELEAAGFRDLSWHGTAETGFFEPVVTAVSPS